MSGNGDTPGFWTVRKVRDLSVSLLIVVLAFKLAFAEFKFDMSAFNFSDFLSLILAISAVGLSSAFYFKADDSAKQFYNNSYNFTKDIATILGRIETGFGEKLSTLNKGYDDINRRLGQSSSQIIDEEQLGQKISSVETKLKSSIDDVLKTLSEVGNNKEEAQKLRSDVEGATSELLELRNKQAKADRLKNFHPDFVALMSKIVLRYIDSAQGLSGDELYEYILSSVRSDPECGGAELRYMKSHAITDRDGDLTVTGKRFFKDLLDSV